MVKKLNDEYVLQACGGGALALGAAMGAPKLNEEISKKAFTDALHEPLLHHGGLMAACIGAANIIASKADNKTRKDMLKLNGVGYGLCGGVHLYHAFGSKKEKKEVAIPMAAASLAMAGVAMAAGFMKEDKPAAAAKK